MLQKTLNSSRYIIIAVDAESLVSAVSGASSCASRREAMVTVVCLLCSAFVGVVVFGGAGSGRAEASSLRWGSQRKLSHGLNYAAPRDKPLPNRGRLSAHLAAKRRPRNGLTRPVVASDYSELVRPRNKTTSPVAASLQSIRPVAAAV